MPDDFILPPQDTALDLSINGSIGSFAVKSDEGSESSVRVQYIQTHVGFAVDGDVEERLLQQLAPVREAFDIKELGFDELMQRDIDDARVSTKLIPYLLEEDGEALVKLFPPIIVVVLPTDSTGRPADYYPAVEKITQPDKDRQKLNWKIIRSGAVGSEAFEFKQMDVPGRGLDAHNYAQLKLNTTGCKLAIVDGQHRAMALLALYRNWKQWPEKTRQYQDYYKRWARSVIKDFDLSGIRLPVMLCTFPDLHSGPQPARLKVAEACRSVFLALNKNARPVSRARNYLLDDNDLVAHLLRTVLGHIKQQDVGSQHALRLWNVELDSEGDRRALSSPIALTGVMHLYSLIEFLMLNNKWSGNLSLPRQNLWKKRILTDCIRRLHAKAALGVERCERANRSLIEKETAETLCAKFSDIYGRVIVKVLDSFRPYRIHNECALGLEAKLRTDPYGSTYHSILFEGQGIGRVFTDYVDQLSEEREEISGSSGVVPPALQASFEEFEKKRSELDKLVGDFYLERSGKFLSCLSGPQVLEVDKALREVYRNTFTTEAFQLGLVITFFEAVEKCRDEAEREGRELPEALIDSALEEYLEQINKFFDPGKKAECWNIFRIFYGEVNGGHDSPVELVKSSTCLKKILVQGELKPDEWPKFRYLLIEVWKPSDPLFRDYVARQVGHLRLTAVSLYQDRELSDVAKREGVRVNDLEDSSVEKIKAETKKTFCKALEPLGVKVSVSELNDKEVAKEASEDDVEEDMSEDSD